jgi:hypothetical protein
MAFQAWSISCRPATWFWLETLPVTQPAENDMEITRTVRNAIKETFNFLGIGPPPRFKIL